MRALDVQCGEEEVLEGIRQMIDPEGTGFITFENLVLVMDEQLKEKDTKEDLEEMLKKLDKNNDGLIPSPEFKQYMTNLGLKMKADELEELMKLADPKGEGNVDIEAFAEAISPPKN